MDGQRFDELARAFASGVSRRHVLRGLIGVPAALAFARRASATVAPEVCDPACGPALQCCGGECVPLDDPVHCGGCGIACDELTQECCGAACVTTRGNDPLNCGGCGNACGAGAACASGICCPLGWLSCTGECVDPAADEANCGSCGNPCSPAETCSGGQCVASTCDPACGDGLTCCDSACVDTQANASHCGGCGRACPGDAFAPLCCDGFCAYPADPATCGDCNTACAANQVCALVSSTSEPAAFLCCVGEGGSGCAGDADCCPNLGLVCTAEGVCVPAELPCGLNGDPCSVDTDCCVRPIGIPTVCRGTVCFNGTCLAPGATCGFDEFQCCSGRTCRDGICAACQEAGEPCNNHGASCCDGLVCTAGAVCAVVAGACAVEGADCDADTDCCKDLVCANGSCAFKDGGGTPGGTTGGVTALPATGAGGPDGDLDPILGAGLAAGVAALLMGRKVRQRLPGEPPE